MEDFNYTPVAKSSNGTPLYECACVDCGAIRIQDKRKIGTRCMKCASAARVKHGNSSHPLYKILAGIINRCENPNTEHYQYYGGKGVYVHSGWKLDRQSFIDWAEKNNYKKGLQIDRIDNDGPYAPWNCRFISAMVNSQKRSNSRITLAGAIEIKKLLSDGFTVTEAARKLGSPYMSVWHISKGNTWRNA